MKILSIVWYKILPPEFGGQKGISFFNKYLARYFPLTCLCSKNNFVKDDPGYKILPLLPVNKFQFLHFGVKKKIRSIAKKENATHIILEHPYHAIAANHAKKNTETKLIVHAHNIESERFRIMGKWWWRLVRKYEKWAFKKADLILFKTREDLDLAVSQYELDPDKCMILPYGIDPERKKPAQNAKQLIRERHQISPEEKILLFSGTLDYRPNAIAAEDIFKKIIPLLEEKKISFRIIITGRNHRPSFSNLKKLFHPLVIMAGEVTDIENYFSAADVFINAVRETTGVQTKTIEALSYGLNVVCFNSSLRGIDTSVCSGKILPVPKNDFNDFVNKTEKALQDNPVKTPEEFFKVYSFPDNVEKFAARLKSI